MPTNCPVCEGVVEAGEYGEVFCPACGSSFLVGEDGTTSFPHGAERLGGDRPAGEESTRLLPRAKERRQVGHFLLLERVGAGSFGEVWKARDCELDRLVAIKLPHPGRVASVEDSYRFLREARGAAKLRHPGIVPVHEVGEEDSQPFIVSDFIEGVTLDDLLTSRELSFREAAELVAEVAEALHFAHERGVVHRDVKPSNIMMERPGTESGSSVSKSTIGHALLMDFGLALLGEAEATMTAEGEILGTPAYMSPEQASGHSHLVDARTDVYSLGVVLYRMLTGERPFRGNARMLMDQVVREEPRPPRKLNDRIPRDLETITLKAMAKEPARRYMTAAELAADLRRWMAGEPITARPVNRLERGIRWAKRHRAATALSVVSAVALLTMVGLAVALGYHRRLTAAYQGVEVALAGERKARVAEERSQYLNRVLLAEREIQDNDSSGAETLLDRCPTALRQWEWHYLKRQCHTELRSFAVQEGQIWSVKFSPDGKLLATGGTDGTARLWDVATGEGHGVFSGHGESSIFVEFSPDGATLASICGQQTNPRGVLLHDVQTEALISELPVYTCAGSNVLFTKEGRELLVSNGNAAADHWILLADRATGAERRKIQNSDGFIYAIAQRPDGNEVAGVVGNFDLYKPGERFSRVRTWNTDTGAEVHAFPRYEAPLLSVAYSLDGRRIVAAGYEGVIHVWNAESGQEEMVLRGHKACVNQVAFSPDGSQIGSASDDGSARIWDAQTGEELYTYRGHRGQVLVLAFSPDGRTLATCGVDGRLRLWDATSDPSVKRMNAQCDQVNSLAFSPDGRTLATGASDSTLRFWDWRSGRLLRTLSRQGAAIWCVAFSPDGRTLASAAGDWQVQDRPGQVRLWNVDNGELRFDFKAHQGIAWCVAFSPDSERLVSCGGEFRTPGQEVIVWEVSTGQMLHRIPDQPNGSRCVSFLPDGRSVLASIGPEIHLLELETGRLIRTFSGNTGHALALDVSRDGRSFVGGSWHSELRLWHIQTGGSDVEMLGHKDAINGVALSRDSTRVFTASSDGTVKVWDPAVGQGLLTLRSRGTGRLTCLALSLDGQTVAAGTEHGEVLFWDVTNEKRGVP